jgi:hypothetical protein
VSREQDSYEYEPVRYLSAVHPCFACGQPYRIGEDGYCSMCLGDREPMRRDWQELQRKWARDTGQMVGGLVRSFIRRKNTSEWEVYQLARRAAHYGLEYLRMEEAKGENG